MKLALLRYLNLGALAALYPKVLFSQQNFIPLPNISLPHPALFLSVKSAPSVVNSILVAALRR
jgi:hypothetical protein